MEINTNLEIPRSLSLFLGRFRRLSRLHFLLQFLVLLLQLQGDLNFPSLFFTYEVLCEKEQMKRDDMMSSLFFNYPLGGNGSLP